MRRRRFLWLPLLVVLGVVAMLFIVKPLAGRVFGVNLDAGLSGQATLQVPPGFRVSVFAHGLDGPRFMALGPDGTLFVAERGQNRIVALPDRNSLLPGLSCSSASRTR